MFFHHYAKQNLDGDQTLFWLYTKDLAHGEFHSIYVYGQDYNVPLESVVAVPLIWLGMEYNEALPLSSMLLTLVPFGLMALYWHRKKKYFAALLALSMPLLLPTEWQMISSAPRGFVGGISLALIGFYLSSTKRSAIRTLGYSFSILSLIINPNALIILFPFGLYHLYHHRVILKELVLPIALFILAYAYSLQFKMLHASEFIHRSWKIRWSLDAFIYDIVHINDIFKGVSPIFYEIGALVVLILIILIYYSMVKGDQKMKWLIIPFTAFLILTLGINKVSDGSSSVFFPYSRMYLGVPFVLILFGAELERVGIVAAKTKSFLWISLLAIGFYGIRYSIEDARIQRAIKTNSGVVQFSTVNQLKHHAKTFSEILDQQNKEILVFYSKADLLCYGSAVLEDLNVLYPAYERRTWKLKEWSDVDLRQILVIDWEDNFVDQFKSLDIIEVQGDYPLFEVTTEGKKLSYIYR